MEDNTKKSPLKMGSLRHAGQSLDEKIYDDIISEVFIPMVMIILVCALAVLEWIRAYFDTPYMPWAYTIIAVIIGIYYIIKIRQNIKKIRNEQLGRDGERAVGEVLDELRLIGYRVYHDIVGGQFNVDHIIVGPAGVFVIETKTYRKRVGANSQIYYDGNKVESNNISIYGDPIRQAKGEMYWLEGFINREAKIEIKVKPVVIFPEWYINKNNNNAEVLVSNEKAFSSFLKKAPMALNQEQINLIASHIESHNRSN